MVIGKFLCWLSFVVPAFERLLDDAVYSRRHANILQCESLYGAFASGNLQAREIISQQLEDGASIDVLCAPT